MVQFWTIWVVEYRSKGGDASLQGWWSITQRTYRSGRNHHEQNKQSDRVVALHLVILGYKSHVSELFHFFGPSEDEEQEENKLWMKKMKMKKVNKMKKVKIEDENKPWRPSFLSCFHPFPSIFVRPCAAPQAVAVGVRGIVVSNHGGRACGNAIGLEA